MARANLNINANVVEEFLRAQETKDIRFLMVKINEETLMFAGKSATVGSAQHDFDILLKESLSESDAMFALFNLNDDAMSPSTWMLLTWVPDGCKVRDKMLYSSSKEDLKRSLGVGCIKLEYAANLKSDVSWEQFQSSRSTAFDADLLSESEKLLLEEKALTQGETMQSRSTAMGVMPFAVSPAAIGKFAQYRDGSCNWLEMTVELETVQLVAAGNIDAGESLQKLISQNQASFLAVRLPNSLGASTSLFVFCCPESVPVRAKMTMSSSKASVLAAAAENGVRFDKTLEVRGADEVDELLRSELSTDAPAQGSVSSAGASLTHSKPQRPGRGKARVGKFQAEA